VHNSQAGAAGAEGVGLADASNLAQDCIIADFQSAEPTTTRDRREVF
jgi:hypothetical protein